MCVLRTLFLAVLLAILTAAQTGDETDQGSAIDPNGGVAKSEASVRIDDNGMH
jgi:parvulin-like peptidyl-prolyl isomerase